MRGWSCNIVGPWAIQRDGNDVAVPCWERAVGGRKSAVTAAVGGLDKTGWVSTSVVRRAGAG